MFRLSAEHTISSAHYLNDYKGPCAEVHGHNWKIVAIIAAEDLDEKGMVIDFSDFNRLLREVVSPFDHKLINDMEPFDKISPTAERLARFIYEKMEKLIPEDIVLEKIQVWETENFLVEYSSK